MSKIIDSLPFCNDVQKKKVFQKIIDSPGLTLKKKRDMIREILLKVKDPDTQNIAKHIYHDLNDRIKAEIYRKMKDVEASLKSDDSDVKLAALARITDENMTQYRETILGLTSSENDPFVLATMISALKVIGNKEDAVRLTDFLESDDPRVRANTVETIERLGNKDTFEKIILLVNDPDSRVKANVAKFFKKHGYYETIDILKKMVYSGKRAQLVSAVYVLERMDKKGE
ncbi:MAG: HEAT repeat domain-containing protein, partial [Candidatus Muiribacteriaceae bacterium]